MYICNKKLYMYIKNSFRIRLIYLTFETTKYIFILVASKVKYISLIWSFPTHCQSYYSEVIRKQINIVLYENRIYMQHYRHFQTSMHNTHSVFFSS